MKTFIISGLMAAGALISLNSFGAPDQIDPNQFSPGASILSTDGDEIKIKTKANTVIEVEFRKGKMSEASGDNIAQDIFNPGNNLLSLDDVKKSLSNDELTLSGDWSLDQEGGEWIYEIEGLEKGKEVELKVSATDAKILKKEID